MRGASNSLPDVGKAAHDANCEFIKREKVLLHLRYRSSSHVLFLDKHLCATTIAAETEIARFQYAE